MSLDFFGEDKNAKANFLALYNALHGTKLDAFVELEPLRLEQVMYMAFRNDVACLGDGKIIALVEHQSTINANMPLRFLQYAARLYERIENPRDRYLRCLKKIPTPEFYVFYNGEEDYPESTTLRLSDAFMTIPEKPALEVVVSVTNINYTKGSEILHTCKPLKEYTLFVDAVQREEEREIALKEGSYQAKLETAKPCSLCTIRLKTFARLPVSPKRKSNSCKQSRLARQQFVISPILYNRPKLIINKTKISRVLDK